MRSVLRPVLAVLAVLLLTASPARLGADHITGNGGFWHQYGTATFGHIAQINIDLECQSGYTCGLTNLEVDWDDGSAIDSVVDYLPMYEPPLEHEYAQNGLYHAELTADDNMSNWLRIQNIDFTIN